MNFGVWWSVALVVTSAGAEKWQWPEPAASVRIDTKVRFVDDTNDERGQAQADEAPFHEPAQTDGFYNRAGGAGRFPVRVEAPRQRDPHALYLQQFGQNHESDGTLDSLQHCRCLSRPDCAPRADSARACGAGKFLCCYKGQKNTEYFNEIENERPSLLPNQEGLARPFPPAPGFPGDRGVLAGPGGASGTIGPHAAPPVLVGPGGPTGVVGPPPHDDTRPGKRNPDVLVGPDGPTNIIGPADGPRDVGQSESAQRGILVGPGGPTGIIGPRGFNQQRPVLVGPGGPTGLIGPRMLFNEYYGRQRNPGVLVGPGGPTGVIGPGRQLLVGPGGPTGRIGPHNYFV